MTNFSSLGALVSHSVKTGGLALRNPCEGADRLHKASTDATEVLVASLMSGEVLSIEAHKQRVKKAGKEAREERKEAEEKYLRELGSKMGAKVDKRLKRMKECGSYIQAAPDRMDGTELSFDEWHDNIRLRYGMRPRGLPSRCDGCGKGFTVEHGLSCKCGGLVCMRHDDVRDEFIHLCGMALSEARVGSEPNIFYGNGVSAGQRNNTVAEDDLGDDARGDVSAHGFWRRGRTTIFDIRITDTDAKSYGNTASEKVLEKHAREKKKKYEEACRERRRDFTPLVYSVDGLACNEARAAERRLAALLAAKWDRQFSEMVCFVRRRMALAVARSTTLLLRGDRSSSWRRRAPDNGVSAAAARTMRED